MFYAVPLGSPQGTSFMYKVCMTSLATQRHYEQRCMTYNLLCINNFRNETDPIVKQGMYYTTLY